ncbi:PDDEXK nuclease domain-containing protein [Cupriavidus necator]|uniref:PDDEXK nuclease domain-containing protein n=1 Tax=Cupriavidus necator TaxID=106590 RepID=UPI003F50962E
MTKLQQTAPRAVVPHSYLSAIDSQVKAEGDGPSIGLLLCKENNRLVAEYALRGMAKPMGVAEYQLMREVPPPLAPALPTIAEIEAVLGDDATEAQADESRPA